MIDLFSLWFGGFALSLVITLAAVNEFPRELQSKAVSLLITAALWPLVALMVLWWLMKK